MAVCGLCGRAQALLGRVTRGAPMRRSEERIILTSKAAFAALAASVGDAIAPRRQN